MKIRWLVGIAFIVAFAAPAFSQTESLNDRAFKAQVSVFVETELRLYPERATHLGDHRFA